MHFTGAHGFVIQAIESRSERDKNKKASEGKAHATSVNVQLLRLRKDLRKASHKESNRETS